MKNYFLAFAVLFFICGCGFHVPGADEKFGKQYFISALSIIELHKIRNGGYPETLNDLEYLGDWDAIWLSSVEYKKVDDGYNLFVTRGWVGTPELSFPAKFKTGLGIKDTNVAWSQE